METAETTGNPAQMKRMNIESVYRALIDYKAATRAEIAQRTKISITTIRALMEELRAKEEIVEASIDASSGGRRAIRYTLNPKKNQILSVFYTDNEVFYEIAALDGQIIQRNRIEKSVYESEQSLFDVIDTCLQQGEIRAIALGVPGIVDNQQYMHRRGLNEWDIYAIGERVQQHYGLPTLLENDLNAMAVGYADRMAKEENRDKETIDLVYLQLNCGCVCAGSIVGGKVVRGGQQFAGELSDMPFDGRYTLIQALRKTQTLSEMSLAAAKLVCMINCMVNPSYIVLGGERVTGCDVDRRAIELVMDTMIPNRVQPEMACAPAFEEDYLQGLRSLATDRILPLLLA